MKNIDYVIKRTAKELGLPEEDVKPVLMEYWKTGMDSIIHMKSTTTTFRHIGNFTVSKFKLTNYLMKMIRKTRKLKKADELKQETIDYNIGKIKVALVHRNILAKHYNSIFKNKKNGV